MSKSASEIVGNMIINDKKEFNETIKRKPPKWSDTPSWLNDTPLPDSGQKANDDKKPERKAPPVPWSNQVIRNVKYICPLEAPTKEWWKIEENKKRRNLENEIDINSIKAALKGVRNEWTNLIKKHKATIESMIDAKKYNWDLILKLKFVT